jgi:hypothetical protein
MPHFIENRPQGRPPLRFSQRHCSKGLPGSANPSARMATRSPFSGNRAPGIPPLGGLAWGRSCPMPGSYRRWTDLGLWQSAADVDREPSSVRIGRRRPRPRPRCWSRAAFRTSGAWMRASSAKELAGLRVRGMGDLRGLPRWPEIDHIGAPMGDLYEIEPRVHDRGLAQRALRPIKGAP